MHALLLYGSRARAEADCLSDTDVLLLGSMPDESDPLLPEPTSNYSWEQFWGMQSYGNLFLHHLRLEATLIGGDGSGRAEVRRALDSLPSYRRADRDISSFATALQDVDEALGQDEFLATFELASIATVVRHASILGCYVLGSPTFGRYKAVETFANARGIECLRDPLQFRLLYDYRLNYERGFPAVKPVDRDDVRSWLGVGRQTVKELANVVSSHTA
jgi:hypothetical protein